MAAINGLLSLIQIVLVIALVIYYIQGERKYAARKREREQPPAAPMPPAQPRSWSEMVAMWESDRQRRDTLQ